MSQMLASGRRSPFSSPLPKKDMGLTPPKTADALLRIGQWHKYTGAFTGTLPTDQVARDALEKRLTDITLRAQAQTLVSSLRFAFGTSPSEILTMLRTHSALLANQGMYIPRFLDILGRWINVLQPSIQRLLRPCLHDARDLLPLFLDDVEERLRVMRSGITDALPSTLRDVARQRSLFFDPLYLWRRLLVPPTLFQQRLAYLRSIPPFAWQSAAQRPHEKRPGGRLAVRLPLAESFCAFLFHASNDPCPKKTIALVEDARDDVSSADVLHGREESPLTHLHAGLDDDDLS